MNNLTPILVSFGYIGMVIVLGTLISKISKSPKEVSRKFIHIMVGNWVFLYPCYNQLWSLLFVPIVFIIINTFSLKYALIEAMERDNDEGYGTIYYAISLTVLSYLAFTLQQPILLYVGTLIMTYGDGIAAIIGKKYGKNLKFKKFPEKSLPGSLTVALVSFIVTLLSLTILIEGITILPRIIISIITSIFAVYLELIGNKGLDNLILPIGASLITYLSAFDFSWQYLIVLMGMIFVLGFAYFKESITLDGGIAALIIGASIYQLSDTTLLWNLLAFFIIGSVISKITNKTKDQAEQNQEFSGPRNYKQVFANALPSTLIVWYCHIVPVNSDYIVLAYILFATSFADTFASELGMLSSGKVVSIINFKPLLTGVSGGVSVIGTLSGLLGSVISSFFVFNYGFNIMILVALLGFMGMLIDSLLGAIFQRKYLNDSGRLVDYYPGNNHVQSGYSLISNNTVNVLTLCIVMFLSILII